MNAPFLDFYHQNEVLPVRQDTADETRHFSRRDHLYRRLGLPPIAFRGASIIEFGCGTGDNASYLAHCDPDCLYLVDGTVSAIKQASAKVPSAVCETRNILDYKQIGFPFDIAICEGVIPHQKNPSDFAKHVGSFVAPDGVLVITVADYFGVLSEVLRRLIRDTVINARAPMDEQLKVIRPIFESHASALPGMSRPIDDWLIDTIIQPWYHPLFPMDEAIRVLDAEFEVLGTSPQFIYDWRWYKDVHGDGASINERVIEQYKAHRVHLLDAGFPEHLTYSINNDEIGSIALTLFHHMLNIENNGDPPDWKGIAKACRKLAMLVPHISNALHSVSRYFENNSMSLRSFAPWFGHGQQYISFVRKA